MPKLNLDIFSAEEPQQTIPKSDPENADHGPETTLESKSEAAEHRQAQSCPRDSAPRFIPVGFYPRHLSALDDAVIRLRRSGYWKASKSAIIRNLIEAHVEDLDRFGRSND